MKTKLTLIFLLKITLVVGQNLKEKIWLTDINQFSPEGYVILDTATGDLNKDSLIDLIVLYKKTNEEEALGAIEDYAEKRPLAIYLGQGSGYFKLAAWNSNVAYCYDCGGIMGDPYQTIVIKNGYFTVEHYGGSAWRWTRYVTFRYSSKDKTWFLHKDGGESFHISEPEYATTNIRTVKDFGQIPFEKYDIYADR